MSFYDQIQILAVSDEMLERTANLFGELAKKARASNHPKAEYWDQLACRIGAEMYRRWEIKYPPDHPIHKETEAYFQPYLDEQNQAHIGNNDFPS